MKIKDCFKKKKVLGSVVMTPVGVKGRTVSGIITLNKPGYDIWQWLDEGLTAEEIYPKLKEKYKLDDAKAKADTDSLIAQLMAAGVFESDIDWQHENLKDL